MRYGWLLVACLAVLGCKDKGDAPKADAPPSKAAAPASAAAASSGAPASAAPVAAKGPTPAQAPVVRLAPKASATPAVAAALSAEHTVALIAVERPHALMAQVDKVLAGLPAEATADMPPQLRDPAQRKALLGFDPGTAAGWRSAGLDASGGLAVVMDDRLTEPFLAAKIVDQAAFLATFERLGTQATLGAAKDGITPVTINGKTGLMGTRGGYTLFLGPDKADDLRGAFAAVMKPDRALADDSTLKRAFSDDVTGLWISGYANGRAIAGLIKKEKAAAGPIADFYAERFEAMAFSMGETGGAMRLLASAKGVSALRQLFGPKGPVPAFSKHIDPTRAGLRLDINFAEFFDGLLALIPESMAQPRSMVLMGKNAVPMALGASFDQLAGALTGHFAASVQTQSAAGPPIPVIMAGVKDGAQLDAVLKAVTDRFKQNGKLPVAPGKVGGKDGYIVDGPMKLALVHTGTLLFAGPLPEVEAAMSAKTGLPAKVAAQVDSPALFAFFLGFEQLLADLKRGGDPEMVEKMIPAAKAAWGDHLTDGFLVSHWVVDGRGLQLGKGPTALAVPGILAAVAIPAFVKYIRRSKSSEAVINVRRMADAAIAHAGMEKMGPDGKALPAQFPATAPRTPAMTACDNGGGSGKHYPAPGMWDHPTWKALNFAVNDPFYYQYEFVSDGKSFTARVLGDLDCDGVLSTWERTGVIGPGGATLSPNLYKNKPLE